MLSVELDQSQLRRLQASLGDKARRLPREVQTVVNAVARKISSDAAKSLTKVLPLKQKTLRKIIKQKSKARPDRLVAVVGIFEGYPIPLRYFKPTQLKRGVTYKTDKRNKGRSVLRDAFILKQYGNNVYRRRGKERTPLEMQYGPKPGDFYQELNIVPNAVKTASIELKKQMERRIKFNVLKAQGAI